MEEPERRVNRSRGLERSLSYSAAIGNSSQRSSFEIPTILNTDIYTNEETKKHYRISQSYVEGREISFPTNKTNEIYEEPLNSDGPLSDTSQYSSEDENMYTGLTLTIDIEQDSPKSESTRHISNASTQPMVSSSEPTDMYDRIDVLDSIYDEPDTIPTSAAGYSTPYTRRRTKGHRRVMHGRRVRSRRCVMKNGEENVPVRSNIPLKSIKYMRDTVNTVINSKWRFLILGMIVAHFMFWLTFAGLWYAVSTSYQDVMGDGKEHCITGTSSFAGLLMMSVETQMTIGYGSRYPNEECPDAIIVMVLEIVAGTALSALSAGLLFTKLIRPNRHVSSVGFSRKAAVCLRDGELCLQFRVWDLMNVHLIASTVTAYIMKPIRTLEGELVQNYIQPLKLKQANAFLLWPITVVHVINKESPLYDFSAQDMMDYRFEIVVCLTGSSKNMGAVTQSRTSYLSKEIIWGYRFKNVLHYSKQDEGYTIDTENLNTVEQVETPLCSASLLKSFEEDINPSSHVLSSPTMFSMTTTETFSPEESSAKPDDSLPSSPSLNRFAGTQRSYGWNFKRFYPEKMEDGIQRS